MVTQVEAFGYKSDTLERRPMESLAVSQVFKRDINSPVILWLGVGVGATCLVLLLILYFVAERHFRMVETEEYI
jgi:hypothetical protein